MTTPTERALDQLVADARSGRDAAVNSLDAVQRQSRAVGAALAARVDAAIREHVAAARERILAAGGSPTPVQPVRDSRFDPEDEWDVGGAGRSPVADRSSGSATHRQSAEDDEDYPQTWLR